MDMGSACFGAGYNRVAWQRLNQADTQRVTDSHTAAIPNVDRYEAGTTPRRHSQHHRVIDYDLARLHTHTHMMPEILVGGVYRRSSDTHLSSKVFQLLSCIINIHTQHHISNYQVIATPHHRF